MWHHSRCPKFVYHTVVSRLMPPNLTTDAETFGQFHPLQFVSNYFCNLCPTIVAICVQLFLQFVSNYFCQILLLWGKQATLPSPQCIKRFWLWGSKASPFSKETQPLHWRHTTLAYTEKFRVQDHLGTLEPKTTNFNDFHISGESGFLFGRTGLCQGGWKGVKVKVKVKKNFESSTMVSFQRMKEDFDDISTQVGKTNKNKI